LSSNDEIRAKINDLAAEFEMQHVAQNNLWGAALGNAELAIDNRFETLRLEIMERIDHLDVRQEKMLELLEELQESLRGLQGRPPCMHPDTAGQQLEAGDDAG
jgi:hypothetical protein